MIAHVQKSMNFTLFDCRWVPCSAKFVVLGNHARGTGALQIYEMSHGDVNLVHEVNTRLKYRSYYISVKVVFRVPVRVPVPVVPVFLSVPVLEQNGRMGTGISTLFSTLAVPIALTLI